MRLLVHPHLMEIGGSQLNAIELAARAQQAGHDVVVFGPDGPLVERVGELGLEYLYTPVEESWPSLQTMNRLCQVVQERRIDLVHAYEWGPALDVAYGPHLRLGIPMVITVMSMDVPGFLPVHVPLAVGTRELADAAAARHQDVHLLEPPIDTDANAPGQDPAGARRRFGVHEDDCLLAVVCRLSDDLDKTPGVLEAISAVHRLATHLPVRLLIAGEGPRLDDVRRRADEVNSAIKRHVVIVAGGMLDPRPAYEAADIVLGMGSSAMKGMAFGKPLVVQGTHGFWEVLTPDNVDVFLEQGWFGEGVGDGVTRLERELAPLVDDPGRRQELGAFGRDLVVSRFSLDQAATRQEAIYTRALARPLSRPDIARRLAGPAVEVVKYKVVMTSPQLRSWTLRRAAPPLLVTR